MRVLTSPESPLNKLFLIELEDGNTVEAVHYRGDTLCVSTQVGCPIECKFCVSGREGLLRNLTAEEIYGQYELVKECHAIKRIAVAGIGEPLANWENVKSAFWKFKEEHLKVSFYTTGFPLKNLRELIELPHAGVSISVHSLNKELRKELMPFAGNVNLLIDFLKEFLPTLSRKKRGKVSLAYLLMEGVNDSREDLESLSELASSLGVSVSLLFYNDILGFSRLSPERYEEAFLFLRNRGVRVTLSNRFRKDKLGGCGTLAVNRALEPYKPYNFLLWSTKR